MPSAFWRGSESVSKIYLGTAQVWPAGTVPGAPTITSAVASLNETNVAAGYPFEGSLTNVEVEVVWTAPASNGGSAITGYVVSRGDGNLFTVSAETRSYTFTGVGWSRLTCNTWTVSVRAVNAVGQSAEATATAGPIPSGNTPSAHVASKTFVGDPEYPGVRYTVEWTPVCSGGPWTGYQAEWRTGPGGDWTNVPVGNTLTTTLDLPPGSDYIEVRVRAVDSANEVYGDGPWSSIATW